MLAAKGGAGDPRVWVWLPEHIVLLLSGWLVQLSMGVAYWILPRIHLSERGRRGWAWAGFGSFQLGLILTIASLTRLWWPPSGDLFVPAVILQTAGVALFAIHAWPRIRPTMVRSAVPKKAN